MVNETNVTSFNATVDIPNVLRFLDIYETTSYVIYGLAAGLSSCLVMCILYTDKKLWKKFSMFFWLASSNLSSCLGLVIIGVVDFYQKFHDYLDISEHSDCFARLYPFMITIGRQTSSTINLVICLERVIAIAFPFRYNVYWTKRGKIIVYYLLGIFVATSAVVAVATGWHYESKSMWICNPPSVFHPIFVKFQRFYPIFCDGSCALLTLVMLYLYTRKKRKVDTKQEKGVLHADHTDPVINKVVSAVVLLTMVFGFVPDTIYIVWAPISNSSSMDLTPFTVFSVFYQVLPFINICSMLLLHCLFVKDFRSALLRICNSSATADVKDFRLTTHF